MLQSIVFKLADFFAQNPVKPGFSVNLFIDKINCVRYNNTVFEPSLLWQSLWSLGRLRNRQKGYVGNDVAFLIEKETDRTGAEGVSLCRCRQSASLEDGGLFLLSDWR